MESTNTELIRHGESEPGSMSGSTDFDQMLKRVNQARAWGSRGLGLAQMGTDLAGEVLNVVEGMHGTIERAPLPWAKLKKTDTWGITGLVYRSIRRSFTGAADAIGHAARALDTDCPEADDRNWLSLQSVINGVLGDRLESENNPLAIRMSLSDHIGQPLQLDAPVDGHGPIMLFVHGLCMSQTDWEPDFLVGAHPDFRRWCEEKLGAATVYLRYNSGRSIEQNGRELSELIDGWLQHNPDRDLIMIGHSMGGLISRSALLHAAAAKHSWPERLTHLVCLGSPHHGSHWERLGELANGFLMKVAYTAPFYKLGNVRSAGIRALHDGQVMTDRSEVGDSPANADHTLLLAATRSGNIEGIETGYLTDDKLVPVGSALGENLDSDESLINSQVTRHIIAEADHFTLLWGTRSYRYLKKWLLAQ